jgi:hypothetical protein
MAAARELLETRFRAEKKRLLDNPAADQEVGSAPSKSPSR